MALREEIGAEAHIFRVSSAADQIVERNGSGSVVFNPDSVRIMGDRNVFRIAEMAVQADDIQSDFMENGKIIRRCAELCEYCRIGIGGNGQSCFMGNLTEFLKVLYGFFRRFRN